jgi:hypothetical protein
MSYVVCRMYHINRRRMLCEVSQYMVYMVYMVYNCVYYCVYYCMLYTCMLGGSARQGEGGDDREYRMYHINRRR